MLVQIAERVYNGILLTFYWRLFMNKSAAVFIFLLIFGMSLMPAQTSDSPALRPIIHNFSANNNTGFTTQPVTRTELDLIVQAGLRAPSAGNRQPWLITVVQNVGLAQQILPQATEGNILIVVSGAIDGPNRDAVILDCGLTAQNMFIAAQAMGLGARQFTNNALITRANNLKTQLGIPADHTAIIVTRVGRMPAGVDAVSSASPRANPDQKVVYR